MGAQAAPVAHATDQAVLHRHAEALRGRASELRGLGARIRRHHEEQPWAGAARRAFDRRLAHRLPAVTRLADDLELLADHLDGQARRRGAADLPVAHPLREGDGYGSHPSAAVHALQDALTAAHHRPGREGSDGLFGPHTLAAVEAFQRQHGLPATGVADEATLAALGLAGGRGTRSERGHLDGRGGGRAAPDGGARGGGGGGARGGGGGAGRGAVRPQADRGDAGQHGAPLPSPQVSERDWDLVQQVARRTGIDPYLFVAIGIQETGWGRFGDGRPPPRGHGHVLGVGSYDSGSTSAYGTLRQQLDTGADILRRNGVSGIDDVRAGKLHVGPGGRCRWATADTAAAGFPWSRGVERAYDELRRG